MPKLLLAASLFLVVSAPFARADQDRASFGSDITVSEGESAGDIACAFCSVHINGDVKGDVAVFFGNVNVNSGQRIGGDTAVIGGDLNLADGAEVKGDVSVVGGSLNTADGAVVDGSRTIFPRVIFLVPLLILAGIIWLVVYLVRRNRYQFPAYPPNRGVQRR